MRWRVLLAFLLFAPAIAVARPATTTVAVLDTLHQMHAEVPAYDNGALRRAILALQPDVLCVELRPDNLAKRPPEKTKQEYPAVIYPLIDQHHYRVYAMEPAQPQAGAIIGPYQASAAAFNTGRPAQARAFGQYVDGLYAVLKAHWTSASAVNDGTTDAPSAPSTCCRKHWWASANALAGKRGTAISSR